MVGCQSSGTTWLAWLLHFASQGSFSSELGVIRAGLIWFKRAVRNPHDFRAARFGEFADMFRSIRGGQIDDKNKWNAAYPVLCEQLNLMNESGALSYWASRNDVDAFLRELAYRVHVAGRSNVEYWGDKYPEYLLYLEDIHSIFPDARWIFVIRDPISTIHSLMTTRKGQSAREPVVQEVREGLATAVEQWEQWNWNWFEFRKRLSKDSYIEINFSELQKDPRRGVEPLNAFLGSDLLGRPSAKHQFEELKAAIDNKARGRLVHRKLTQFTPSERFATLVKEYGFDTFAALGWYRKPSVRTVPVAEMVESRKLEAELVEPHKISSYDLVEPRFTGIPIEAHKPPILAPGSRQELAKVNLYSLPRVRFQPGGALQAPSGTYVAESVDVGYEENGFLRYASPVSETGLFLASKPGGFQNYFHWLSEILPVFMTQSASDIIVVGRNAPRFTEATVELANKFFGVSKSVQRVDLPAWFENAVIAGYPFKHGVNHSRLTTAFGVFVQRVLRELPADIHARRKIVISREDSSFRVFRNESELVSRLCEEGYEALTLSKMPVVEQWRAFREAEHVVAFHGAGLTNAMFMAKGHTVHEIVPVDYINRLRAYWDIVSLRKLNYHVHVVAGVGSGRDLSTLEIDEIVKAVSVQTSIRT
jgi:hypothetical protein